MTKHQKPDDIHHSAGLSVFLTSRRFRLLGHILFVAVYMTYTVYCVAFYRPFIPDIRVNIALWSWFLLFNVGLAYLNIYFLMPRYLYRRRYAVYAACMTGCIALMALSLAAQVRLLDALYRSGQFLSTLQSLKVLIPLSFACPMAITLYRRWQTTGIRIQQLENATMQSELEQLKKQINPHFLFNMLNNAMVLVKTDSQEASQVLHKLKDLLSYQLTDSAKDEAFLTDDIQFLNDFLNLEKIRRDRFDFTITVEDEIDGVLLPPLLFIPFVENAVKHNPVSDEYLSYVHIRFRLEGGKLHFTCVNSKPAVAPERDASESGLGLANVRRRLSLLYPEKHLLEIESGVNEYRVNLQIFFLATNSRIESLNY
jgi:signal transduction histidine kinase